MLIKLAGREAVLTRTLWLALAALVCGCATTTQKSVTDWHDAVVAVREQSATTFRGVNDLVREAQLKRAADLANLKEDDFHPGLDAKSIATWNRALDNLAAYGASLSALLSPGLASGVGDSTKQLGASIATSSKSTVFQQQPGLSSALGKLGAKLASLSAAQSAQSVMAQTNSAITEVLDQMARMINDDSSGMETGILQTVHADWTSRAADVRAAFLDAKTPADKRDLAAQYAALLEKRDAADAALLGLRGALLELAVAHSRAAAGGSMDTSALIASIREQTAFFKGLLQDLKPAKT
jgi:hypothetical protein